MTKSIRHKEITRDLKINVTQIGIIKILFVKNRIKTIPKLIYSSVAM